ncbi:hypothetical protein C6503_03465 [Candidatus Poribacteria bacterium]|nr:MAG: hypothetical protein C6503_03465 [Candidatus Poribacteria bacterium]
MQLAKPRLISLSTLIGSVLFFLMPLTTPAQTVNIDDPNLRKAINEALGKAANARMTADEMATLTHLEANNRDIQSLKGLQAAKNLKELQLRHNGISDLSPLAGLITLQEINFEDNNISDLSPLSRLIHLRDIHLSHNLIEDISPLSGLINASWINLGHNIVSDWSPLAKMRKLHGLNMSHNPIADLAPLAGLISLEYFHTWGTPILDLAPLSKLPKLREISICGGEISDISSLQGLTNLRDLYLPGNEVSDISVLASLTGLRRLSLENNDISDISPLSGLTRLTWIDLRNNAIADVSPLANLPNLAWVDLSSNRITDVSSMTSLRNLAWMGLTQNAIADVSSLEKFSSTTSISHSDFVNAAFPEAGPKITGPWLWAIVPGYRLDQTDLLAKATNGAATEVKVATFGATEDKSVGSGVWKAHTLAPAGGDNINEMTDALGWGSGSEIYEHVVYGSLTFNAPQQQETTMLVGSDDEVKVWLNGELVHYNPILRGAGDYQDAFPVRLKRGPNVLLVALSNRGHGAFSGFFGFAKDAKYTVNPIGKKIAIKVPAWDVNTDGVVNVLDLILVGQDLGKARPANPRTDVNGDRKCTIADLVLVAKHIGELSGISAAPSLLTPPDPMLTEVLQKWIELAELEDDGSQIFQDGIANLQSLLDALHPEKTQLLANYPNPFNPETWIPYQLANAADVSLTIYAIDGKLVRQLALGHQPAGVYESRSRAVYWDGRNAQGEPVASGVYFYTLTAGDFTATRKMLIRK